MVAREFGGVWQASACLAPSVQLASATCQFELSTSDQSAGAFREQPDGFTQLNLKNLGFKGIDPHTTGRPAYYPAVL